MRIKPQYMFIIVIVAVVALYFVGRSLLGGHPSGVADDKTTQTSGPPTVQAKQVPEVVRQYDVVARGRTQATRSVVLRSETSGVVAAAPVLQGTAVKAGQVLCRLAVDARQAS